jgi:hypothetical protein
MTQKILIGIAMTAILVTIGIGTQGSAWALTDKGDAKSNLSATLDPSTDSQMLVDKPAAHKGDRPVFMLVPRPQEGIDGIQIPTPAGSDMILVATPVTHKGEIPTYTLVPRPSPKLADYSS